MENKKKTIVIVFAVLAIVLLTIGVAYAALSYTATSSNQKVILGDIYMYYNEMNQGITLEDAMPTETYDATKYFEFTISGKNTYSKEDIWYDIVLSYGDAPDDATRNLRIRDELLKFRLVQVSDQDVETEIFTNQSYNDLSNKRIHVETIPKNTAGEIEKKYRLYMWIGNETKVCSGNNVSDCDYYLDASDETLDWNKVFASIKVNVTGDFEEKSLPPAGENCYNAGKTLKDFTINTSSEAVSTCVTYVTDQGFTFNEGESAEAYCNGTGTGDDTLLYDDILYASSGDGMWYSGGSKFEYSDLKYFIDNNILINIIYGAAILYYEPSCESDVVIPDTISGYPVTRIDTNAIVFEKLTTSTVENCSMSHRCSQAFGCSVFNDVGIESVIIPETVTIIGSGAFVGNQLTSINIPDSVVTINDEAFFSNPLEEITIGSGIKYMETNVFGAISGNTFTIKKTCEEIANIYIRYNYLVPSIPKWGVSWGSAGPYNAVIYGYENGVKTLCDI